MYPSVSVEAQNIGLMPPPYQLKIHCYYTNNYHDGIRMAYNYPLGTFAMDDMEQFFHELIGIILTGML